MAAPSTQPKNSRGGVIRFSDGTGSPVTLTVPMTRGDFVLDMIQAYLNEAIIITARTAVLGVVRGKPSIPTVSFSCFVGNLVGSSATAPGAPTEMATGKGAYNANISTLGASREMTIDIRQTIEGTAHGDTADETVDCEDCLCTIKFTEADDGNRIDVSARILGSIIVINSSNTVTYSLAS